MPASAKSATILSSSLCASATTATSVCVTMVKRKPQVKTKATTTTTAEILLLQNLLQCNCGYTRTLQIANSAAIELRRRAEKGHA